MAELETRWQKDERGNHVMPPLQSQFLDWLLDDEKDPATQAAWARAHQVNPRTIREWKQDHRFRAEWDRRAAEKNVSTERVQTILDALYRVAVDDGDVQAMKLWLDYSSKMRPPRQAVHEGDYAGLTDDELVAQLKDALNVG